LTKHTKHKGDFILSELRLHERLPLGTILIEVKKYSKSVPTSEVEKFHRDLIDNPDVKAGLFISLSSKISKIKRGLSFDKVNLDNRIVPCVYLCSDNSDMIIASVELLFAQMRCGDIVLNEIEKKIEAINIIHDRLRTISADICKVKQVISNSLDKLYNTVIESRHEIGNIISNIHDDLSISVTYTTPKELFREEAKKLIHTHEPHMKNLILDSIDCLLSDNLTYTISKNIEVFGVIKFFIRCDSTKTIIAIHKNYVKVNILNYNVYLNSAGFVSMELLSSLKSKELSIRLMEVKDILYDIIDAWTE
jgi:hypothetical protein